MFGCGGTSAWSGNQAPAVAVWNCSRAVSGLAQSRHKRWRRAEELSPDDGALDLVCIWKYLYARYLALSVAALSKLLFRHHKSALLQARERPSSYAVQAHFIFYEKKALPGELLAHNKRHKRRRGTDSELEIQAANDEAEGVESQRLQNLAITLDKVRRTCLCRASSSYFLFPSIKRAHPCLARRVFCSFPICFFLSTSPDLVFSERLQNLAIRLDKVGAFAIATRVQPICEDEED